MAEPSREELLARIAELKRKAGQRKSAGTLTFKVSDKGAVSVYGMGRFPVTLYYEQWLRLLGAADELRTFLFPVQALAALFRGKFLAGLRQTLAAEELQWPDSELKTPATRARWLSLQRTTKRWVLYAKRPFGGPQQVVDLLGSLNPASQGCCCTNMPHCKSLLAPVST